MALVEVVGLRKRIDKMKLLSMKVFDKKICKNCLKEYNESDNFNWSCRTHRSEFGGVIWWCCGKKNKDDPGCKFSQHESKDAADGIRHGGKREGGHIDIRSIFNDFKGA